MIRIRLLTEIERLSTWHKWFAWRPVRLTHDHHEIRWLGFIYRKGRYNVYGDDGDKWKWKYVETEFDILKYDEQLR